MEKRHLPTLLLVTIASCLVAIGTLLPYFIGVNNTPPDHVYIGQIHYWPDYLSYVSEFMQGAHGRLVETNLYTETITPSIMSHWPNVLFGAIGHFIGFDPISTYHLTVFFLTCCIGVSAYLLFVKTFPIPALALPAVFFFLFSTSAMNFDTDNPNLSHYPFELWNTPHYIFTRFGPTPHTLMLTLLVICILSLLYAKRKMTLTQRILLFALYILLLLIQPVVGVILLGSYIVTTGIWKKYRDLPTIIGLTLIAGVVSLWFKRVVFSQELYSAVKLWEQTQQVKTTIPFLLASIGPIVPFALVGCIARIRKTHPIERFFLFLLVVGYGAFLTPLPERLGVSNARILFPAYILGLAWFGAVGVTTLATLLTHITTFKKSVATGICMGIFFLAVTPTIIVEVQNRIPKQDATTDMMTYLPKSMYEAFQFLETQTPYDDVVLANPISFMDLRVPALSGHRTVNGTAFSDNEKQKRQEAYDIFLQKVTSENAKTWLRRHHVTYVLHTAFDGDINAFQSSYPFLTKIFASQTATVFAVTATQNTK